MRATILAVVGALALAACGKGSGGTDPDGSLPGEDAGAQADRHDATQQQADAQDDGPPAQSDAAQSDASPQADAAVTGCNVATGQTAYWGNIHAHTSWSDGAGSPEAAYDYARNTAGLDIQILTDHAEQFYLKILEGGYSAYLGKGDAKYVAGTFLAMGGFEYGMGVGSGGSAGHNNVFFSPSLFGASIPEADYKVFYDNLYACAGCIGQFNHPGDGTTFRWDNFEYDADAAKRMRLLEFNTPEPWTQYFDALTKGWSVSPTWNQDNHGANWGTANDNRSGFWMSALDRTQLYDAMLNNRTFATGDKKAWIKLLANGNCWMGSKLRGVTSMPITVEVSDTDNDHGFTAIELFDHRDRTTAIATHDCAGAMTCTASFNVTIPVPPGLTFFVARATMTNAAIVVSAPVWAAVQ